MYSEQQSKDFEVLVGIPVWESSALNNGVLQSV